MDKTLTVAAQTHQRTPTRDMGPPDKEAVYKHGGGARVALFGAPSKARLWGTIGPRKFFGGKHGELEKSVGPGLGWGCVHSVYEEKISRRGAGDRRGPCAARVGVSGEIRKSAAGPSGLFRSRHAGDGDGRARGPANYRSGRAERGGRVGRNWRI